MWEIIPNTEGTYEWNIPEKRVRKTGSKKEIYAGATERGISFILVVRGKVRLLKIKDIKPPEDSADISEEKEKVPKHRAYRYRCAQLCLNLRKQGYHLDHIVPVSFCRKIGLTPEQCCIPENLQYLTKQQNMDKFSFVNYPDVVKLLRILGVINNSTTKEYVREWNLKQKERKKLFNYAIKNKTRATK